MIRSTKIALGFSNKKKLFILKKIIRDFKELVNQYIDLIWDDPFILKKKWIPSEIQKQTNTGLSAVLQQKAGNLAIKLVKAQRNNIKNNKIKPCYKANTVELDQRSIIILEKESSFDEFIKFRNLGQKIRISCPIKYHSHFLKYKNWERKKSVRLISRKGHLFLEVIFEKKQELKPVEKTLGIDLGIKKLMADSDGKFYGTGIESLIDKINRKQQKSKAYKRALRERDEYINRTVKELPEANYVTENLKNLKYKSKERNLGKSFRKKIHYWTYRKVLSRIQNRAEVVGVQCLSVPPGYTSQTCPVCGNVDSLNRDRERFRCRVCQYQNDADVVGALNVLSRGVSRGAYGPPGGKEAPSLK